MLLGPTSMLLKPISTTHNPKVSIFFELNDKYELHNFYLNGNPLNDVLEETLTGENVS